MGMPQLVVTAVLVEGRSKSEVAREYGVSRRWVITLVQRYLAGGDAGLEPRSRRPVTSPQRTTAEVEEEIVKIRKTLDRDGHEAGAATIAFHLQQRHGATPAVSTIWRVLSARGLVTRQPHKRPKSSYLRFAAEQPNERWQLDITHFTLADGGDVEILNIIDDHSRLCLGSHTLPVFKAADVDDCFCKAAASYGDPASLLSDNGAVFTGRSRGHGRVALEVTLHLRGISFRHSRPYHPQTCGKVERFHQTLKKWLTRQPRARTLRQLQAQLDLPPLLQRPAPAPRARPSHPRARLHRPPQGRPHRDPLPPRPLPDPTRPDRPQRRVHPAPQQPAAPHRNRPPPRRQTHPGPGPRPPHPGPHHRRRTTPRTPTRPHQGLPTTTQNVNHVPRHLCTMSRDIAQRPRQDSNLRHTV
jgi:transposase InsO family protein